MPTIININQSKKILPLAKKHLIRVKSPDAQYSHLDARLNNSGICSLFVLFIACSLMSLNAWACTTTVWVPGLDGSVAASSKPSVGGACALEVTGTGYVQDNTPFNEDQFIGRFYFLPQFSGTGLTKIFVAHSDECSATISRVHRIASPPLLPKGSRCFM